MQAKGMGTARVHLLLLVRVLELLRPSSVLEVGSGSGINLFVLSALFPEVRFAGLEISTDSLLRAGLIRGLHTLPEVIGAYTPVPLPSSDAHRRIAFSCGNARSLPFPDGSFDLVLTRLALEQMEAIRHHALSEVSRVARNHVVMVEPFYDWNAEGLRRESMVMKGYFAGKVEDLLRYGLETVLVFDDFPHKFNLRPGLVVAHRGKVGSP